VDDPKVPGEGEQPQPEQERPGTAPSWHRTPVEPAGPPPWSSSEPAQGVLAAADEAAPVASNPPAMGEPNSSATASAGATLHEGAEPPSGGGGEGGGFNPPEGPRSGGGLVRGVFLYIGATSIISGLAVVVSGNRAGTGLAAAVFGVAFAVTFFVAMMLRPNVGADSVRATLGVVSIVFLVVCFGLASGIADPGRSDAHDEQVRVAVAAGLFTFGMGGVAMLIPSAVAAGLALLGLVATVALSSWAAGVEGLGLAAAVVVGGVVGLELAMRVPRLRAHPGAMAWMVNIGAVLVGAAATAMGVTGDGTAISAAGFAGLALLLVAWRWHAVVAAIVATVPLTLIEAYAVTKVVGGDASSQGAAALLVGLVLLLVVAVLGLRSRGVRQGRSMPALLDELVLVIAAVLALAALGSTGKGLPYFRGGPFFGGSGGSVIQPSFEPVPAPTFIPFPTLPPG